MNSLPYWRLSGFYFFFFASLGAFVPYWGLYLQELSFSPEAIGELMAVTLATKVVAPNIWGWMADFTGRRMLTVRIAALLGMCAFVGVLLVSGYWWLMAILALFSFFWNAALPQYEAITLNHLGDDVYRYSRIRLWGSVGFILTVTGLAPLFDRYDVQWLPWVLLLLLAAIWLNTLLIRDRYAPQTTRTPGALTTTLAQPTVIALFAACFLSQASHGPYYTFFSIYLEKHGYTTSLIGSVWALGVIAEVGVFLAMHRLLPRFGAPRLLLLALGLTAVRWLMTATLVDWLGMLLLAQCLHAASFGVFHASAIHLIHMWFPGAIQGRGQALYSSLSFGLGGALGSLLSGYVWSAVGPAWVYLMASLMALLGFVIAWCGVYRPAEMLPTAYPVTPPSRV